MKNVMTWIIGIALTLGMIALLVLGQVSGARDIGEKADNEQTKVSMMISDSDMVTGRTIMEYVDQGITVKEGTDTIDSSSDINDSSLYTIEKTYDTDGELASIEITRVDLSK